VRRLKTFSKFFSKNFEKSVDKPVRVCYTIFRKREGKPKQTGKERR